MVCKPCQGNSHEDCDGSLRHRTYCDCQHAPAPPAGTVSG